MTTPTRRPRWARHTDPPPGAGGRPPGRRRRTFPELHRRTTMTEAAPILEVARVSKRFPGVLALDDVSFALVAGEVHALVGENGAGKSTLIKLLTGVYSPDAGEIRYAGEPVSFSRPLDAQAAGVSTIYQEVNLVPLMS